MSEKGLYSHNKPQWSWAFYDWANSAFATTVMAGFFPLFFKQYWSGDLAVATSTFYLGLGNSFASLLIVILAPILGALADRASWHKRLLCAFAMLGILACACFFLVDKGQWQLAVIIYILSILGFSGANVFYDAMLPMLTIKKQRHSLSALGFSLGYLGGGLLFLVNVVMTIKPEWFGLSDAASAVRWSFLTVSIWWFLFTLPLLFNVKQSSLSATDDENVSYEFANAATSNSSAIAGAFKQLYATFQSIRQHRNLWFFLIAYWLYIDGVATIIRMAVDYGLSIGLPSNSLIIALLLVQFIGFPATLLFGRIANKLGAKTGLWIGLWAYVIATFAASFMQSATHFYMLAVVLGLVQGGVQALSRSLFSQLIPESKGGEYFGFLNMLGKAAAVVGPLLVGLVSLLSGNTRIGILSILLLFGLGMYFLTKVEEPAHLN